jgi:integrase
VIVLVAAATGLRQSELLGLRWRDVDYEARRSVPMADLVVATLKAWSERTPYRAPDDLAFAHPQTGWWPVDRSKLSRRFRRCAAMLRCE